MFLLYFVACLLLIICCILICYSVFRLYIRQSPIRAPIVRIDGSRTVSLSYPLIHIASFLFVSLEADSEPFDSFHISDSYTLDRREYLGVPEFVAVRCLGSLALIDGVLAIPKGTR